MSHQPRFAVISDIDDTIKESHTESFIRYVVNTAFGSYSPVKNMPDLYKRLSLFCSRFYYVSASPAVYQASFQEFITSHFPEGEIVLCNQYLRLSNIETYKMEEMESILGQNPQYKIICVGDSLQRDAWVYSRLFELFPHRIEKILIRLAFNSDANDPKWESIFEMVPRHKWMVFKEPEELYSVIEPYYYYSDSA